jgi:tRNA dimethylallyltransferase
MGDRIAEVDRHSSETFPPLIVVVGPTGAGKSALALNLATALNGEIVNFDSLQLYRGFDIGTAKTPASERRGIAHHLFDVLDAENGYSAGDYARLARSAVAEITSRGSVPIAVGGSGFYLRAMLNGLPALPSRDPGLRTSLEARERRRPGSLHRLLTRLDASAASRMHARDVHKTIRALEIRLLTRTPMPAAESAEALCGYRILQIGLNPDRAKLIERLNARVEAMFAGGLIEEVQTLLAQGGTGAEKPFESLGYKQALQYIRGQVTQEQAILSTQIETRQYAKRQRTWFARDSRIHWLAGFGEEESVVEAALALANGLH